MGKIWKFSTRAARHEIPSPQRAKDACHFLHQPESQAHTDDKRPHFNQAFKCFTHRGRGS